MVTQNEAYAVARLVQLFGADLTGRGDDGDQQHDPTVRFCRSDLLSGAVRADTDGGSRHCHEVLPDRHLHRYRNGGGLYSDCRLQYGSKAMYLIIRTYKQLDEAFSH